MLRSRVYLIIQNHLRPKEAINSFESLTLWVRFYSLDPLNKPAAALGIAFKIIVEQRKTPLSACVAVFFCLQTIRVCLYVYTYGLTYRWHALRYTYTRNSFLNAASFAIRQILIARIRCNSKIPSLVVEVAHYISCMKKTTRHRVNFNSSLIRQTKTRASLVAARQINAGNKRNLISVNNQLWFEEPCKPHKTTSTARVLSYLKIDVFKCRINFDWWCHPFATGIQLTRIQTKTVIFITWNTQ